MEKDLKMYMTEEFIKLNTAEEQREPILKYDCAKVKNCL